MPRREPGIVIEWRCRYCGRAMQDTRGHAPSCLFAPLPELACGSARAHNAHSWPGPDGRVFCPGGHLGADVRYEFRVCEECGVAQNEAGECGYCAARAAR